MVRGPLPHFLEDPVEFTFGVLPEEFRPHLAVSKILEDVRHALAGHRQGLEVGVILERLHGFDLFQSLRKIGGVDSQHGIDDVVGMTLGDKLVFEPRPEKVQDVTGNLFGGTLQFVLEDVDARRHQFRQAQRITLGEDDVDDPQGLAPQGVWIGGSRRNEIYAEEADDGVHLVGDANDGADVRLRQFPPRGEGQIMLIDRLGDQGVFTG